MRTLGLVGMGACVAALTGALHVGADRPAVATTVAARAVVGPSADLVERAEPIRIRVQASSLAPPAPTPAPTPEA